MEEEVVLPNASLILAQEKTTRKDPLDHFNLYRGGWNISDQCYIASVVFTVVPFFIIAVVCNRWMYCTLHCSRKVPWEHLEYAGICRESSRLHY
ncbi:hypothetical protein RYX36_010929 [Vicia faba]